MPEGFDELKKPRQESSAAESERGFDYYIERGRNEALLAVKERFEDDPDERNRLPFHNRRHTNDVMRRTRALLEVVREGGAITERDVKIGMLAGAFHDTVQRWEESRAKWQENGKEVENHEKVMRRRFAGENEDASAAEASAFMDKAVEESGDPGIFSEDDKRIVAEAIGATVPGFNPEKGTVTQPNLKEKSSLIAHAVALADLGTAGMDGPEKFASEGDALFREENLDILEALHKPLNEIHEDQKEYYRKRMLGWSKFQAVFAAGRRSLLEEELRGIPEGVRDSVKKLFSRFDETIGSAKKIGERRDNMTFEELLRDMGYAVSLSGR